MIRHSFFNTLLFWTMVLLGSVLIVPALVLPTLFNHEAAAQVERLKLARIAELEKKLATLKKQNEFRNDPAYLERLERSEFGGAPPGAEAIFIDPGLLEQTEAALQQRSASSQSEPPPVTQTEIADEVQQLMLRYPVTQLFVRSDIRPVLMALGGGMILLAVLLLCRNLPEPPAQESNRATT